MFCRLIYIPHCLNVNSNEKHDIMAIKVIGQMECREYFFSCRPKHLRAPQAPKLLSKDEALQVVLSAENIIR